MDELEKFKIKTEEVFGKLFEDAKKRDELAYVFSLLGINSGMQDAGWEPVAETYQMHQDIVPLVNAPLRGHTQIRLLLLLYCQLTETSYIYHILFNLLLSIEGESPPKVFNFLNEYNNGIPPSVKTKVELIGKKANELNYSEVKEILDAIFNVEIRNAVSHADFILYQDELRLKHRGSQIKKIKLDEVSVLMQKTITYFEVFFKVVFKHKTSYKDGHIISGRKNKAGGNWASITLIVNKEDGVLSGFSQSDPLPTW